MKPFERRLVRWSSWATGLTGLVYLWMKYVLEPSEPWAVVNHPLQPLVLKAHILVAPALVFAVGLIWVNHVWRHWLCMVPAGRRSGILLGLVVVPMVVTGYLIQAVTHPGWLSAVAWAHIGLGVLFLVGLVAHLVAFRRGRKRRRSNGRPAGREEAGKGAGTGHGGEPRAANMEAETAGAEGGPGAEAGDGADEGRRLHAGAGP